MTATNNGWPGKPGVPMNPEKDGWHWVSLLGCDHPQIMEWFSDAMVWADDWTVEACAKHLRYLGPCLTPDESANREDVKWHEGYAVGVLDVRRGTAFGEPDTHYAALQKRCEEAERERDALRRDASQEIATDESPRRQTQEQKQ